MYNCYKYYYQIGPCWFGSDYSSLFAKQTKYSWFLCKGTQLSSKKPCPSRIAKIKLHPRVNSGKSGQLRHIYPSAQLCMGHLHPTSPQPIRTTEWQLHLLLAAVKPYQNPLFIRKHTIFTSIYIQVMLQTLETRRDKTEMKVQSTQQYKTGNLQKKSW